MRGNVDKYTRGATTAKDYMDGDLITAEKIAEGMISAEPIVACWLDTTTWSPEKRIRIAIAVLNGEKIRLSDLQEDRSVSAVLSSALQEG